MIINETVILTEIGAADLDFFFFFFNNRIVLALKRSKKCRIFRIFQSFLSYRQITLPINLHVMTNDTKRVNTKRHDQR